MSLLKLDEKREAQEKQSQINQQHLIEAEREARLNNIAMFFLFGFVGLLVGLSCSEEKGSAKLTAALGTTIGTFLVSGLVAVFFRWLTGKWKMAFIITFCLLTTSLIAVFFYEREQYPYQREYEKLQQKRSGNVR